VIYLLEQPGTLRKNIGLLLMYHQTPANSFVLPFIRHFCMYLYNDVQLTSETAISYPLLVPDFVPHTFAGLHVPVNVSGLNQLNQSHSFLSNVKFTNIKSASLATCFIAKTTIEVKSELKQRRQNKRVCSFIPVYIVYNKACVRFQNICIILGMRRYGHHTIRYVSIRRETIWLFSIRYDTDNT